MGKNSYNLKIYCTMKSTLTLKQTLKVLACGDEGLPCGRESESALEQPDGTFHPPTPVTAREPQT